jgi:hypothetical protein
VRLRGRERKKKKIDERKITKNAGRTEKKKLRFQAFLSQADVQQYSHVLSRNDFFLPEM